LNRVRANQIAKFALQTRKTFLNVEASNPVCPYNLAEAMGLDVRFIDIPSFEGMYLADDGVILIAADRPEGRKSFTCAHEIGHHVLKHGTVIDEIIESGSDKAVENEADFFASMLLMPQSAVTRAGKAIGLDFKNPDPEKVYILSSYLGVSYKALIVQLRFNLKLVDYSAYQTLGFKSVNSIKESLRSERGGGDVFVLGAWWREKSIDVISGDLIHCHVPVKVEGAAISLLNGGCEGTLVQAIEPGIAKISAYDGWSAFVRVSRKAFAGLNQFRHEEEVE